MKNIKKNKGFTLIEILVVIGIIAILAAVVLIAINPARQFASARDSQRTSNVNAILNALGQYIADNKGDLSGLDIPAVPASGIAYEDISSAESDLCSDLMPKFVPALPVDPGTDPDTTGTVYKTGDALKTCPSGYVTGYEVGRDEDGRLTIRAQAQIDLDDDGTISGDDYIIVTR